MSDWDVGRVSPASESVDEKECPKCSRGREERKDEEKGEKNRGDFGDSG